MTFKDDLIADLHIFLDPNDFGDQATYKGNPINGQFFSGYENASPFESNVESRKTWFVVRSTDVPGVVHGDTITIGATVYTIMAIEPEDSELTILRLAT